MYTAEKVKYVHTSGDDPIIYFFIVPFFCGICIPSINLSVKQKENMLQYTHILHICPLIVILQQTHTPQGGVTVCCPPALSVCPRSCSIFPNRYQPRKVIEEISLFLRQWMICSYCCNTVMACCIFLSTNKPNYSLLHLQALCILCIMSSFFKLS